MPHMHPLSVIDSILDILFLQLPTPWLRILTSPAVWAIIVVSFCNGCGHHTLLTCMPTYFKQVLPQLQVNHQVRPTNVSIKTQTE